MKRSFLLGLIFLTLSSTAYAIPNLQLGIADGTYLNETTISGSSTFTLYAYLLPNQFNSVGDTYYLSAALVKDDHTSIPNSASSLGSIEIGDTSTNVTSGMIYGTPPFEQLYPDLGPHGIFPTFYIEIEVDFTGSQAINPAINVADNETQNADMYRKQFLVDLTGLANGYGIHFDLYNLNAWEKNKKGIEYDVSEFAPFSHDAEGTPVPEPGTIALVGVGFAGLAFYRHRSRK